MPGRTRMRADDGAVAVEMALITPLLVLLLFGIIQFGIVLAQQVALGNGARQGARFGVVGARTCAQIQSEAQAGASTIAMAPSQVWVAVYRSDSASPVCAESQSGASTTTKPCLGSAVDDTITVTTRFDSSLIIPFGPNEPVFTLSSKGVFRCEYS